jgi:hypothetical protein
LRTPAEVPSFALWFFDEDDAAADFIDDWWVREKRPEVAYLKLEGRSTHSHPIKSGQRLRSASLEGGSTLTGCEQCQTMTLIRKNQRTYNQSASTP